MRVGDCLRGEVMVDNESKGARVRAIDQSGCEGRGSGGELSEWEGGQ